MTPNRESKINSGLELGLPPNFFSIWYAKYGRTFPWRNKGVNPYGILIAEMLLRQTRAEMVARVWPRLIKEYPDPISLSVAIPVNIERTIEELGFGKQRTKALLQLGASIKSMEGLPSETYKLMALPHVGLYTAHAVACFGFGHRVPVVDLNVVRVISRISGIKPPKDIRRGADWVWQTSERLLPRRKVVEHNYGLLDFAATICKQRSPKCTECLIVSRCKQGTSKLEELLGCDQ